MSKRTLTIVVLCLAALFYLAFMARPRGPATAVAASDVDTSANPAAHDVAATAAAAASKTDSADTAQPAPAPQAAAALTSDERDTLVMYDEMRSAFLQFNTDCLRMGEAIDITVTAHTAALTRLRDKRDSMSVEQQVQSNQRVEAAEGPHLQELRSAMEQAVAKCKQDLTLRDALRRLAKLNAPRDAQPTK